MNVIELNLLSHRKEDLLAAMQIFERDDCRLCAYQMSGLNTMLLAWVVPERNKELCELPFTMNSQQATDFIHGWLETVKYSAKPDTDGSVKKGFHITSKVDTTTYGYGVFASIKASWVIFGK